MFNKSKQLIKVKSEQNKLFEDVKNNTSLVSKKIFNGYHQTGFVKSTLTTTYDLGAGENVYSSIGFVKNMTLFSFDIKKGEIIENLIKDSILINVKKSLNTSTKTYKRALHHYCISDIVDQKEDKVTIIFLPISTSESKVLCGIQKFDKIHLYNNGIIEFYITRLLFQKTMTGNDHYKWLNDTKYKYEGDINARKIIFENIQKDLDENHYSILKDSDLIQPKVEFFSKKLPFTKFKFTDLELQ